MLPTKRPRVAWTILLGSTMFLLLSACVPQQQQQHQRQQRSLPRLETARELALLSLVGDEPQVKVTAVDGVQLKGNRVGRFPADAPPGMNTNAGVWLSPGLHVVHVQYIRNISSGVSFTQGDVSIHVLAGHTYIVHPSVASDFGKVSLSVLDYGTGFPVRCLPWNIGMAKPVGANGKRAKFVRADILACRQLPQR